MNWVGMYGIINTIIEIGISVPTTVRLYVQDPYFYKCFTTFNSLREKYQFWTFSKPNRCVKQLLAPLT